MSNRPNPYSTDPSEFGNPEYGSELWQQKMAAIGRRAFIRGHMGPGGIDHDRMSERETYENYSSTPRQGQS